MASDDSNNATTRRAGSRTPVNDSDDDSDAETVTLTDGDVQVLPETDDEDDDDVIEISDGEDDATEGFDGEMSLVARQRRFLATLRSGATTGDLTRDVRRVNGSNSSSTSSQSNSGGNNQRARRPLVIPSPFSNVQASSSVSQPVPPPLSSFFRVTHGRLGNSSSITSASSSSSSLPTTTPSSSSTSSSERSQASGSNRLTPFQRFFDRFSDTPDSNPLPVGSIDPVGASSNSESDRSSSISSSSSDSNDIQPAGPHAVVSAAAVPLVNNGTTDDSIQTDTPAAASTVGVSTVAASSSPVQSAVAVGSDPVSAPQEEESPNRKRKREESSADETPSKVQIQSLNDSSDDDGEVCSICFEDWSNAGDHRVASLKCGHLFGQSCIVKWLDGTGKKCPQCNEPAKKKDVRVIFCKRLKAIDTAERDRALGDLEAEKKRRLQVEATVAELRVKLEIEKTEKDKLRRDLESARTELRSRGTHGSNALAKSIRSSSPSSTSNTTTGSFVLRRKGAVGDGGSRLVEFCRRTNVIVVSRQQNNALFPGFGVQMVQPDFSQQKYIQLHTKIIKCLSINHRSMLLSVSLDKQIKVTSLLSGNPVISYMSSRPAWSCAWDLDNENVFYVGLDGGLIHAYDTRVPQTNPPNATDEYVKALPKMSMAPVISLNHVGSSNDSATVKGILAGHMDGKCVFYEEKPDPSQNDPQQQQQQNPRVDGPRALTYEPHILPLDGTLISLSVEPSTLEFLATFRPNSKYPRVRHVYGKLGRASPDSSRITCLGIKVIEGGASQAAISKSTLIPRSFYSPSSSHHSSLICAGDEDSKSAFLWDVASGSRVQQIHVGTSVVDVCHFPSRGRGGGLALALLSDKTLAVYDFQPSLS